MSTKNMFPSGKLTKDILQLSSNEPCHEKTGFLHMRKQRRRSASRTAKLISAFVFAT